MAIVAALVGVYYVKMKVMKPPASAGGGQTQGGVTLSAPESSGAASANSGLTTGKIEIHLGLNKDVELKDLERAGGAPATEGSSQVNATEEKAAAAAEAKQAAAAAAAAKQAAAAEAAEEKAAAAKQAAAAKATAEKAAAAAAKQAAAAKAAEEKAAAAAAKQAAVAKAAEEKAAAAAAKKAATTEEAKKKASAEQAAVDELFTGKQVATWLNERCEVNASDAKLYADAFAQLGIDKPEDLQMVDGDEVPWPSVIKPVHRKKIQAALP